MTDLDPALTVPCPTCRVGAGHPCRSRRAVTLHQARREALADLGVQADDLSAYSRKPQAQRQTVLVGRTGADNAIPAYDGGKPPWEA